MNQWMPVLAFGLRCTPTVLRGPLRVRALVCVRWPRTGKSAQMADAAIAFDALQALEIHAEFAAQIAFDDVFAFLDRVDDLRELRLGQILRADRAVNVRALENLQRVDRADAVNVAQRNVYALVRRNFNTNDACHKFLTLPLLVTFVRANDADDAAAAHDFAMLTQFFY